MAVASQLGKNGQLVIRHLGVPDHIVSAAEDRHNTNIPNFHLACLMAWCEIKGAEANPENLKKALAFSERHDLVALVDEYLSGKSAGDTTN